MTKQLPSGSVNFKLLVLTLLVVSGLLTAALKRITIDFDILKSLPDTNKVVADAKYIFTHHPFQDRVVIDLSSSTANLNRLVEKAKSLENALIKSGLFSQVGFKDQERLIPVLISHVTENLPYLFSADELENEVNPLLFPRNIELQFQQIIQQLAGMEGVGQSELIAADPLSLRNLILKRLSGLNPVQGADFYQGFPVSPNKQHVLIVATPKDSGTNTAASREIKQLIDNISQSLNKGTNDSNNFMVTAAGAYRAALDNETIVRRDTQRAIIFATIGITLLLLFSFPRPYIGILSLVPALVGTIAAFFICSFLQSSVSILAIGFGGAIISITVDHSIAYLLFLDRPEKVYVRQAAEEIRAIGLIAVLTTVGAFLMLNFSGFSILEQIGRFAALGIACSFIFVHTVFPKLIPVIPAAKKKTPPRLLKLVSRLSKIHHPALPLAITAFAVVMAFFATPRFNVDLRQMNTVSQETLDAEKLLMDTWGNVSTKIHLLIEAGSLPELQLYSDLLSDEITKAVQQNTLKETFTPSALYPGPQKAESNFKAWKAFWSPEKISALKLNMNRQAEKLGFTADAFQGFYSKLEITEFKRPDIPRELFQLLNIRFEMKEDKWLMFVTMTPSFLFDSQELKQSLSDQFDMRLFDPDLFSTELGQLLSSTFLKMLLIIGIAVVCLIFLFFLDWKLMLISLIPVLFSMVCTIGTLNLMGHPLDIPGLMLAIIVVGMGIDYSLFMIRSYQRYGDEAHPFHGLVRMAILLAAVSTIVGFGVLVSADHYLLHSAGLVSLLGIGYALVGAFFLLPPLLRWRFITTKPVIKGKTRLRRTLSRFSQVEAFPRMFARFKIKLDPMFNEIDKILDNPSRVIDIGCGYGIPAAWILDKYPYAKFFGLDPDPERVRIANKILGESGVVKQGYSPAIPKTNGDVDTAMMLDMLHYLNDKELYQAFGNICSVLSNKGKLIIRVTLPLKVPAPWYRRIESMQIRMRNGSHYYRPLGEILHALQESGYTDIFHQPSGKDREEIWITARVKKKAMEGSSH